MKNINNQVTFLPLGGIGDVTKNMYLYECQDQILIVDCGLGFPDETMIGVDLLIPDISPLFKKIKKKSKICGMVLTHAHEDHIGALPYILPQLPSFPIFTTPLTTAFANSKLEEFKIPHRVRAVSFAEKLTLGPFSISFVRVTHSVPDSANLIIEVPFGVFYHASDFKFDPLPADGRLTETEKIREIGERGVLCLLSDCLRAEKEGRTPSEKDIEENFAREMEACRGKFLVTTYSSNVSRLNQAIRVAKKLNRRVCFLGRSLQKAKEIALRLGYMENLQNLEVSPEDLRNYKDQQLLLLVAGSQGQETSALVRIANDEDRFVKIREGDMVVFSVDPIPGNEVAINALIDILSKRGARVKYWAITDDLHVSGHGARDDLAQMMRLTRPRFLVPISGAFRQMVQFQVLAENLGFPKENIFLLENGQEAIFEENKVFLGEKTPLKNIYVDQLSGEEIEGLVLRDRQKLAKEGILTVLVCLDVSQGKVVGKVEFHARAFVPPEKKALFATLELVIKKTLVKQKGRLMDIPFIRSLLSEKIEKLIFKKTGRRPLVLPIVIEV